MIRKTLIVMAVVALALPVTATAEAQTYSIDATHSSVNFKVRHLVSKTAGRFNDFGGTVVVDRENMTNSTVEFSIKTASIDTDSEDRDGHLKSEDFLHAEKYPEMTFKSTKVVQESGDSYFVTGDFTLRGVTKTITIPVEILGFAPGREGKGSAGFETSFSIDRKDYGIEWNRALDAGGFILGDEVAISINIEAGTE